MEQLTIMVDLERCIGCNACEAACKLANSIGPGHQRIKVAWAQSLEGLPEIEFIVSLCQQCQRPICVRSCKLEPKAIQKRASDGVVLVDSSRCVGCLDCVNACPYGVMSFDARRSVADKCTLCAERRDVNLLPACIAACPSGALSFGKGRDLIRQARSIGREIRDIDHFGLRPSVVYLEPFERHEGIPEYTHITLPPGFSSQRFPHLVEGVDRAIRTYVLPQIRQEAFPYNQITSGNISYDSIAKGVCGICFNSCGIQYYLKDGQVVGISGNPEDPATKGRICSKGLDQVQQWYNKERLTHPLKRTGERGEGRFEPISWDQALNELAERLQNVRQHYGNEALAIYTGTRSGILNLWGYAALFGELFGTPHHIGTGPLCATSVERAYVITQGVGYAGNSFTEKDLGSADFLLIVGFNMAESRPVYFGLLNDWRLK